jgi:hypothetical protein
MTRRISFVTIEITLTYKVCAMRHLYAVALFFASLLQQITDFCFLRFQFSCTGSYPVFVFVSISQ